MRILFVAMSESVHAARWINQFQNQNWDIRLFSANQAPLHPIHQNLTTYSFANDRIQPANGSIRARTLWPFNTPPVSWGMRKLATLAIPNWSVTDPGWWLARVIERVQPDIIQSLEITLAGSHVLRARTLLGGGIPPWIITNWGSDIQIYARQPEYEPTIRKILASADYYSCECQRDIELAKEYGFQGKFLPVLPNAGGIDVDKVQSLRAPGPVSRRKVIVLKGYQHFAGRALVGIRAIELCAPLLKDYRVVIISAGSDVQIAAHLVRHQTGIQFEFPRHLSHQEVLKLHGSARISMGLSVGDGISTMVLEAMAMGSFPIQSCTSCADEWFVPDRSGFLVPPNDPQVVADRLAAVLRDDRLVDEAQGINQQICRERLNPGEIAKVAVDYYQRILEETRGRRQPVS